jgi:hypothetical protein
MEPQYKAVSDNSSPLRLPAKDIIKACGALHSWTVHGQLKLQHHILPWLVGMPVHVCCRFIYPAQTYRGLTALIYLKAPSNTCNSCTLVGAAAGVR